MLLFGASVEVHCIVTQFSHTNTNTHTLNRWSDRNFKERGFTVVIGGPVESGKTALVEQFCHLLPTPLAVVTNDIFTQEDAEFAIQNQALPATHISPPCCRLIPFRTLTNPVSR